MPKIRCKTQGCSRQWDSIPEWRSSPCSCALQSSNKIIETTDEVASKYDPKLPSLYVEIPQVLCTHIIPNNRKAV